MQRRVKLETKVKIKRKREVRDRKGITVAKVSEKRREVQRRERRFEILK